MASIPMDATGHKSPLTKTCHLCGLSKPIGAFYRASDKPGHRSKCIDCYLLAQLMRRRRDGRPYTEVAARWSHSYRRRLRIETLHAYGAQCECCGEKTIEFLTIDHIYGGGTQDRKRYGADFYHYLRKQGWPR